MTETPCRSNRLVVVVRWVARGLATLLFLFWGAFFLEHLGWFTRPDALPPLWVFLTHGLHLLMLVGFLVGWKWEIPGALLVLASSAAFFWIAAGTNFLLFTGANSLPALLWLYCGVMTIRSRRRVPISA